MDQVGHPVESEGSAASLFVNRIRPGYEQVAAQLQDHITRGLVQPGERLPSQADLAGAFGVSLGTIREAIRTLAARELVRVVRGSTGGTFVAETDASSISNSLETGIGLLRGDDAIMLSELLESRLLLEVPAAKLAGQRRTDEHLAALRTSLVSKGGHGDDRFDHHRLFHALILEAAGNRLLSVMTLPVFGVIRSRYVIPPTSATFWDDVDSDHSEIFEYILNRDAEGAGEMMHSHLVKLNEIYREIEADRSGSHGSGAIVLSAG